MEEQKQKRSIFRRIARLIIYVVLLFVIIFLGNGFGIFDTTAEAMKKVDLSVLTFIQVILMILLVLIIESLAILGLNIWKPRKHRAQTFITLITSLIKYLTAIVIISWGLKIIGVDVGTIVASLGILALIIGFGAESLISDVVTGFFMLFENQYNVGDIIEVNGFRGTVKSVGIRTTRIMDLSGNVKVINNSDMKNILNRSDNQSKSTCEISIPYPTDLEALEKRIPGILDSIYEKHSDVMQRKPVYLGVQELAASGIVLRFVVDVAEKDIFDGRRILNHDILLAFRHEGVECPYPQTDVHIKND